MNVEDLLISKNIIYTSSGADYVIRCLNPEHEDNNPSMRIDKLTGVFNCLSCGYSGDIFKYFNETKNIVDIRIAKLKEKISKINVKPLSMPLGYELYNKEYRGISTNTLNEFQAFTHTDSDFSDRIVFPITNVIGDIVVFQARRIYSDAPPKYKNIPPNRQLPLYPSTPEIYKGSIILVEGLFDMLNLYDKGLTNVVAAMGLSSPSKRDEGAKVLEKFGTLKLQGVNTIYILFDGDKAGQAGAKKLEAVLKNEYIVDRIELEEDLDPGDMTLDQVNELKSLIYE